MAKSTKRSLFCLSCGTTRVFQVDGTYTCEDEHGMTRTKYEFAHCLECNNPLLVTYDVKTWSGEYDDSDYKIGFSGVWWGRLRRR